jgi:glycosyltransferase involved in cell wall biosynthesis
MKIMLAGSVSPFTAREELHWAQAISKKLSESGHQVDLFNLPVVQDPLLLSEQIMASRLLSVDPNCDLLITIGYPAFVLKHPRKRALLFSLASPLHEWFDTEYGVIATPQYHSLRHSIQAAEKSCLAEADCIVCGSANLAAQLKDEYTLRSASYLLDDVLQDKLENGLPAQVRWVVTESTLEPCDRYDLLLEAVAQSSGDWKLAIFVPSSSAVYRDALTQRIEKLAINERIAVVNAPLSTSALEQSLFHIVLRYQSARIPEGTIRAMKSNIPVVTVSDSGALLEVVKHNVNGLVVKPDSKSIAQWLDQTCTDTALVEKLAKGNQKLVGRVANVEMVVRELVG